MTFACLGAGERRPPSADCLETHSSNINTVPPLSAPVRLRKRPAMWSLLAVVIGLALLTLGLVVASWRRPVSSLQAGRLLSCPDSPNCVCSFDSDAEHVIPPFAFDGDPSVALARLRSTLDNWPRTRLVTAEGNYLRFEVSTPILTFVDDVEFLLDSAARVIHVRSASRVGYSDLGANRARVEQIRAVWMADVSG